MQIVIEIDEEDRADIANIHFVREDLKFKIGKAIINGMPLPKGHGDLIERDALRSKAWKDNVEAYMAVYLEDIDDAPTIIEADKGEQEGKE